MKKSVQISKKIAYKLFGIILIILITGYYAYYTINNMHIADKILENTGYTIGSPDYIVLKNYYFNENIEDYKSLDYNYSVVNNTLFVLAKTENRCQSIILFALPNGKYPDKNEYKMSGSSQGELMREDIRKFFSIFKIANVGNNYAYMLIIDSRSEEERLADISETFNIDKETARQLIDDRSYTNEDDLQLTNQNGDSIEKIEINDGHYVAYCDSFNKEQKDYSIMVSYQGDTSMLLTYEDIVNAKITLYDQ